MRREPKRRIDMTGLLTRARAQGWRIQVLDRGTLLVTHPKAGEMTVSAFAARPAGRDRLLAEVERQEREHLGIEDVPYGWRADTPA
jgi:hypothetical protein